MVLDGTGHAAKWKDELARKAEALVQELGRPAGLAMVTVGNRSDSELYVKRKDEACGQVVVELFGMACHCNILAMI